MAFPLFGTGKNNSDNTKNKVVEVKIDQIIPNRYQPRKVSDQDGIRELAQTIDEHGLLQPIVLREYEPAKYGIIAGERRYRAMELLKRGKAPAIIEKMSDQGTASLALIENLQRSQSSPVEEAQAYRQLMDLNHLTQSQLIKRMGKSQSFIANRLRLLRLIIPVQTAILDHRITERRGRALLDLDEKQQHDMLMRIVNKRLTVRQTEDEVTRLLGRPLPSEITELKATAKRKELASIEDHVEETADVEEVSAEKPAEKRRSPKRGTAKKARSKKTQQADDARLALNTIKKSIRLATNEGFEIKMYEEENGDTYQLTIEVPKKQ